MSCHEFADCLQSLLDGDSACAATAELERHLDECASCREMHVLTRRLTEGLKRFPVPIPPVGFAERIAAGIVIQHRRQRRFRRFAAVTRLAASVLLLTFAAYLVFRRPVPKDEGSPVLQAANPALKLQSPPSLKRSVEEAGEAVVALTQRAAHETIDQGRLLLPMMMPVAPAVDAQPPQPAPGQHTQALLDVKEGMTSGLEPMATSARRAVDLFMREIPSMESTR